MMGGAVFPGLAWRGKAPGMFLLVDKETMCIRYRHSHQNTLLSLMHIEFTNTGVACMGDAEPESFMQFTDAELKLMYLNMTGQKYNGWSRDILVKTVIALIAQIEPDTLDGFSLSLQAASITEHEQGFFMHAPKGNAPIRMQGLYAAKPRTPVAGYVAPPTPAQAPQTAPAHYTQAASTPAQAVPRSELPATAPKEGSTTGRVWGIAEAQWRIMTENGTIDVKALRKAIVLACEAEGINPNTASVQYAKWKSTKNL